MKIHAFIALALLVALTIFPQAFAKMAPSQGRAPSLFAEESEEDDSGPPEAVVRKLGAMMAEQKFTREATTTSDGKIAPKDTTIYPITITDAEGKNPLKVFFFKNEAGKWTVFDEAGNKFSET